MSSEEAFTFKATKDGKVFIFWNGKQAKVLIGDLAKKFIAQIADMDADDAQMLMAKRTGNFKRGNER